MGSFGDIFSGLGQGVGNMMGMYGKLPQTGMGMMTDGYGNLLNYPQYSMQMGRMKAGGKIAGQTAGDMQQRIMSLLGGMRR